MNHSRSRGRRRRSRRKVGGVVIRSVAFLLILAGCVAALRWLSEPSRESRGRAVEIKPSVPLTSSFASFSMQTRNRRVVYPFSVVPGGVASGEELREAADHDRVVSEHYSGFDYKRARLVQVSEPKLVYLSYRRGDKIFWTRKQASLHKGETLLTDGHITARTRCGNQVAVLPQANTSPEEPTIAELDRPDAMASGMSQAMPSTLDSNLVNLDPGLPLGPASSVPGNLFAGGPPPGGFIPMPGGGIPTVPTGHTCPPGDTSEKCHNPPPPPPPPPPSVPEPGTIVLVASGATALLARAWRKRA